MNRPSDWRQRSAAKNFDAEKTQAVLLVVARDSASFQDGAIAGPAESLASQTKPCLHIKLDPQAGQIRAIIGRQLGHQMHGRGPTTNTHDDRQPSVGGRERLRGLSELGDQAS